MPTPSLLLVHGAATGAWVWDTWRRGLAALGWQASVLDLRGHGRSLPADLTTITMDDYVADLASVTVQIERAQGVHPVLGGWSMGGMVAMMYAAQHPETPGLLLWDSMLPAELSKAGIDTVRRFSGAILTPATFGIHPDDRERSRRVLHDLTDEELDAYLERAAGAEESGVAFRQVLRGISVPAGAITSPSLVLSPSNGGKENDANRRLAEHLGGDLAYVPTPSHWGIVCHAEAIAAAAPDVDRWLHRNVEPRDVHGAGEGEDES